MNSTVALITTNQIDIGIRILSGVLRSAGIQTRLINLSSRENYHPLQYPDEVKNALHPLLRDCDVVGISSVDMFFRRAQELAGWVKSVTGKRVLLGGMHAQLYPEETINTFGVDGVCEGEGIKTIIDLVKNDDWDNAEIDDFWLKRKDGTISRGTLLPMVPVKEMHLLPLPDYSYDDYWLLNDRTDEIEFLKQSGGCFHVDQHQIGHKYSFVSSFMWGCVNKCNFCNITALSKKWAESCEDNRWFRIKPNAVVFDELKLIKKNNPNMRFMCIMDNDFAGRNARMVEEFFEFFRREIGVPVYLMVSPNTLSEDKLQSMVEGGVTEINMGIESNEITNIQLYGRMIKDDAVLDKARMINRYKDRIYPFYDLVIFNPQEDEETVLRTINLIRQLPVPFDLVCHHLTLGTETLLYKKFETKGASLPREIESITTSDYHDFDFDEYANWPTLYPNLLLEWMGGPHDDTRCGRLPRYIDKLVNVNGFATVIDDVGIEMSGNETLDYLTSQPVIDYFEQRVNILRDIHVSIDELIFTNQEAMNAI